MDYKKICVLFGILSLSFCIFGCNKSEDKTAKKPYVMYNDSLYGISSELPKTYPYNSMADRITYVVTITEIVSTSELPTKNFQANSNSYKDVKMYVDESNEHIYLRFNEGLDNDELIRFDKDDESD